MARTACQFYYVTRCSERTVFLSLSPVLKGQLHHQAQMIQTDPVMLKVLCTS